MPGPRRSSTPTSRRRCSRRPRPAASIGHLVETLRARFDWTDLKADDAGRFPLATAADTGQAETWLLRSLIKQREGFMSRHFERKISLALTRRLALTRITPDVMTLVSLAIGLAGAPFFLSGAPAYQLTGALLFLLHSILDGCDGELARLKFMESPHGAILDFWGDNVVHVAVFACMSVGLSFAQEATWPLALGALTVAATLAAAARESSHIMQDTAAGEAAGWMARLAEAFSSRDFIYLIVAMSAFGKAHWFLIFASVGTPIFFLLLLAIGARRRATRLVAGFVDVLLRGSPCAVRRSPSAGVLRAAAAAAGVERGSGGAPASGEKPRC